MVKLLSLISLLFLSACGTTSYTRSEINPTNQLTQLVKFRNRGVFINSKTYKFGLDNLTARGTRNGLNFGSNEQEVASQAMEAFFNGLTGLLTQAVKLGATSGASSLLPAPQSHSAPPSQLFSPSGIIQPFDRSNILTTNIITSPTPVITPP